MLYISCHERVKVKVEPRMRRLDFDALRLWKEADNVAVRTNYLVSQGILAGYQRHIQVR